MSDVHIGFCFHGHREHDLVDVSSAEPLYVQSLLYSSAKQREHTSKKYEKHFTKTRKMQSCRTKKNTLHGLVSILFRTATLRLSHCFKMFSILYLHPL